MKKLQVNMVFRHIKDNIDFRIIHISHDYTDVVCIELNNKKALPYHDTIANLESQLKNCELEILENDPYYKIFDENAIQERYLKLRNLAFEYIKELCSNENLSRIYNKNYRYELVMSISEKYKVSKVTIYKNLRLYLQGGMTPNSLLTYTKLNRTMNYSTKTGPKRKETLGKGIIIDGNALLHINSIYTNYYLKVKNSSLHQAYLELLNQYYSYITIENGREVIKTLDDDKIPTYRQFKYHINKIRNAKDEIISKMGKIKYQQNKRPTLSKEDINIWAPGQLYQVDSTPSDLYLVSNFSRNIVVGKAVLYIVIDVYSRLITGFYAGLEESSWIAAMMAYVNMNENKVEFCKKYDIDINEKDWPAFGIPSKINTDRGESISKASSELVNHLGITIENNPPYCPDMKGIVERWFRGINEYLQRYVPGGVRKDHKQRGGEDYRNNAVLNIREFNQIIIKYILSYNNTVLQSFSMNKDMIDNDVIPTPANIWNYGATKKLALATNVSKEQMMLTLMPKDKATITSGGIKFKDLFYTCETGIRENWFLRTSDSKKTLNIAYDPRNLNKIYIYDNKTMKFEVCNMLEKSFKDYKDISLDELIKIRSYESRLKKINNTENISLKINVHNDMQNIIENALKQSKAQSKLSKGKLLKHIPLNKKIEKMITRREEFFDLDPKEQINDAKIIKLDNINQSSLTTTCTLKPDDKASYEELTKKLKDENNSLLESIIFGDGKED